MNSSIENPYSSDPERAFIWEMCVRRDLEAFLAADWSFCSNDFISEGFSGWNAHFKSDPQEWQLGFPNLESYRDVWIHDAQGFSEENWGPNVREQLYGALRLDRIEIGADAILVHKVFDGNLLMSDGTSERLHWQSLFNLRKEDGRWKQAGFVGYLPIAT
ncbi:hypothetical protein N9H09_00275 [bacterium]|nr:hypothetical protein [bacterium]